VIKICIAKLLAMPANAQPALPLSDALQASKPLALLAERLRESKRRFDCVAALLPDGLAAQAQPGPVDVHGWTLLAANAAVAAKLRQLVPLLVQRLGEHNFAALPIRIRVSAPLHQALINRLAERKP
jgi:hypothetical protein